ncbi:MAG: hypothetical protein ABIR24_13025 [Verrucomicrobiota bacterium]
MKSITFFSLSLWFVLSADGAPIYEPFDYSDGANLIGQANSFEGVSWLQAGPDTANQPVILAENLNYSARPPAKGNRIILGGLGTSARFSFSNVHTIRTNALYYSFLMQATDITSISTSGIFWAAFNNTQGSQTTTPSVAAARLITRGATNESGTVIGYQIGVSKNSGTVGDFQFATNIFTTNDVVFVVVGYDYTADNSRLWINPDPATFGAVTAPVASAVSTAGGVFSNIRSFVLFNRSAAEPARVIVDDLMIGTSWADVVPKADDMDVVIAPVSQRLVPGQDALFEIKAGRANSFQWQSGGTNIPGATGTRLIITNAQTSDGGTYSVVMSNAAAVVTNSVNLTVVSTNHNVLSPLWSLAPGSRPYITAGDHQRTLAYYALSNHLYVLSRTSSSGTTIDAAGLTINVLNATNGEFLHQLSLTNSEGTPVIVGALNSIILSGIAVADDGAIYACNVSDTGGGSAAQWKLYRWVNGGSNTVPVQVFGPGSLALQTISLRWGDTLSARGSGTNTQIMVDDDEGLYGAMFTPTDETLNTFEHLYSGVVFQYFTQSYGRGSAGRSLFFGTGDTIWQMRRSRPYGRMPTLTQSAFDFVSRTSTVVTNLNVFSSFTGPFAMDLTNGYLAAIIFAPDASIPDSVALYDIANLAQPILLSRKNFPVNRQSNGNSFGQVIVSSNRVFALDANNGLTAFAIAPPIETGPQLTILLSGNNAVISWPSSATGFVLEKTVSLSNPDWATVNEPVQQQNGQYVVTDPISGTASFYRLKK